MAQIVSSHLVDCFSLYSNVPSKLVIGSDNDGFCDIAVLMPIYNHSKYLDQAILSCLNQVCEYNFCVIIVDNNHPEHQLINEKIIRKFNSPKIKYYVNEENIGACGNWNRCIELANAKYVTFCHDDDMLAPNALSQLMQHKMELNNNKMVVGLIDKVTNEGVIIPKKTTDVIRRLFRKTRISLKPRDFYISNYSNGGGTLYDKESLLEIGGFNKEMSPCFDYALNAVYTTIFGAVLINSVTLLYRKSDENDSLTCYVDIPATNKRIRHLVLEISGSKSLYSRHLIHLLDKCEVAFMKTLQCKYSNLNPRFLDKVYAKGLDIFSVLRDSKNFIFR